MFTFVGEAHELHPMSDEIPAIQVHVCDDPEGYKSRPGVIHTPRPPTAQDPGPSSK